MERKPNSTAITAWTFYREILNLTVLARRLGISQSSVSQWRAVPDARVLDVEKATGIPAARLRPDGFRPWKKLTETT